MIAGLYQRPAGPADVLSPACDPIDALEGHLPTYRLGDAGEPEWLAVVAQLGDPFAVRVEVEVIGDVVELPTRSLTLVPPPAAGSTVEGCPDCGADGLDPCRPKSNPSGRPLTRWHRRRRLLAGQSREAGRGEVLLIVLVVVLVLAVAGGAGTWLAHVVDRITPCVSSTASGLGATDCPPDPADPATREDTP